MTTTTTTVRSRPDGLGSKLAYLTRVLKRGVNPNPSPRGQPQGSGTSSVIGYSRSLRVHCG